MMHDKYIVNASLKQTRYLLLQTYPPFTGVYPYDWMNDASKLQSTSLPPKDCFYSKLNDSHITDDEYEHAKRVWEFFNCQTFKDYHELYLATDVLLLTDVFQSFRRQSLESYSLDPACYISLPGLAWDAMLLKTGVSLELLSKEKSDIYLMVEQGIRGGISVAIKRHAKADENSALMYLDANNLYGWAMSQPLPYGGFKTGSNLRVCSCHFRDELKVNGPKIFKRNADKFFPTTEVRKPKIAKKVKPAPENPSGLMLVSDIVEQYYSSAASTSRENNTETPTQEVLLQISR